MTQSLQERIVDIIRRRGPISVASFMELALYDPRDGYYTRAAQKSGKTGDFYTSVDVSPLFGAMIADQLAEMWQLLGGNDFQLVEAGAGNGRLSRDILDAAAARHPDFYRRLRVTLVERSASARAEHPETFRPHARHVAASLDALPERVEGAIVANELLDALPVTVVQMTDDGLREVAVDERDGVLIEELRPLPGALASSLPAIEPGQRIEIGHEACLWMRSAAASLSRGFLMLFDYGYTKSADFFRAHPEGTLMAYRSHRASGDTWLDDPGTRDITAHVDFDAMRAVAAAHGLRTLGIVDQGAFLMSLGLVDRLDAGASRRATLQRLAARTLIMPGGLGDTMKAMVCAKGLGAPALRGLQSGRLT